MKQSNPVFIERSVLSAYNAVEERLDICTSFPEFFWLYPSGATVNIQALSERQLDRLVDELSTHGSTSSVFIILAELMRRKEGHYPPDYSRYVHSYQSKRNKGLEVSALIIKE